MSRPPELPSYRPIAPLGRGGTAEVVRVTSEKHHCQFALKYPLKDDPKSLDTFARLAQREQHLIGRLKYPGLVRLVQVATDPPPYLVMELCPGSTLDQAGRPDSVALALNLLSAVAVNLQFLQTKAIIHGDLKPHNIFLPSQWRRLDDEKLFYVKLSDFSLGRYSYEPDEARAGLGTVGYMAPETVAELRTSFRSDLFALGVIAYQLLTGIHPFMDDESDPVKINSRVREDTPVPLQRMRPDVPGGVSDLVERLLAKDESERPGSGWEVCQALKRAGAHYPFEKALRPAHFFSATHHAEKVKTLVKATDQQWRHLQKLHGGNETCLRLLLTGNYVKGCLAFDGQGFVFSKAIYWPAMLRRKLLETFQQLPFGCKKLLVKAAIAGNLQTARDLEIIGRHRLRSIPEPLPQLLQHLIRPRLVRVYSAGYAAAAEKLQLHGKAAELYVQAGDLQGAERCAYQAATAMRKEHHHQAAVAIINKVARYARTISKRPEVRQLLMMKGNIHKQNGETELALVTYRQIIDLYCRLPADKLLAETYKDLGDLHRIRQDCDAGLEALKEALTIYKKIGAELEISQTLNNLGNIHWMAGNLRSALARYRSALRIQRRLRAPAETASTLGNIGSIYAIQGRFRRSIQVMDLSLQLKKEVGDAGEIARSLNNLGYVYHLSGHPDQAVSSLSESLMTNRRIGSKKEILFNLENLTYVMITAGRLRESLPYLKEGMTLSDALDDRPHSGVFNLSMAIVLKRMGRFAEAERRLAAVEATVQEIDDRMLAVLAAVQRAGLRHLIGDNTQAQELALQALTTAERINDKPGQLNALLLMTKVSHDTRYVDQARTLIEELHLRRERTLVDFNFIESLLEQGRNDEAYGAAVRILPRLDTMSEDVELAWMCNVAAELMLARNNVELAQSYLSRAWRPADTNGMLPEMVTTLTLQGRIDLSEGNYEQCYANYKEALDICKRIVDNFECEADRRLYRDRRSTQFIVSEIKRLASLMGQKQRAGP